MVYLYSNIINILTNELPEKKKYTNDEICLFTHSEQISNINLNKIRQFIFEENKKLFIFDLEKLGREWTENISEVINKDEIYKDKYKDGLIFIKFNKETSQLQLSVLNKNMNVTKDSIESILSNLNKCTICSKMKEHVKIDNYTGKVICYDCFNNHIEELVRQDIYPF